MSSNDRRRQWNGRKCASPLDAATQLAQPLRFFLPLPLPNCTPCHSSGTFYDNRRRAKSALFLFSLCLFGSIQQLSLFAFQAPMPPLAAHNGHFLLYNSRSKPFVGFVIIVFLDRQLKQLKLVQKTVYFLQKKYQCRNGIAVYGNELCPYVTILWLVPWLEVAKSMAIFRS